MGHIYNSVILKLLRVAVFATKRCAVEGFFTNKNESAFFLRFFQRKLLSYQCNNYFFFNKSKHRWVVDFSSFGFLFCLGRHNNYQQINNWSGSTAVKRSPSDSTAVFYYFSSKYHFHCSPKKMILQYPIVITSFHQEHT